MEALVWGSEALPVCGVLEGSWDAYSSSTTASLDERDGGRQSERRLSGSQILPTGYRRPRRLLSFKPMPPSQKGRMALRAGYRPIAWSWELWRILPSSWNLCQFAWLDFRIAWDQWLFFFFLPHSIFSLWTGQSKCYPVIAPPLYERTCFLVSQAHRWRDISL